MNSNLFRNISEKKILLVILFLALVLRVINYQQMKANDPIFEFPIVDSKEYVDDANYYNTVSWLGPAGPYFHPPLYSYFVGVIFLFFGSSIALVRYIQIFLDVINAFLVFLIARKIFTVRVALVSVGIYSIYIRLIQYSIEILPPILIIFLFLLSTSYRPLIANALLNNGKVKEAGEILKKATAYNPTDRFSDELYKQMAHYYKQIGDGEASLACFAHALELNPLNYQVLNSLGFEYKMRKEFDKALPYLYRAQRVAPCYPVVYLNIADCFIAQNDMNKALSVLESYSEYCPSPHPEIATTLGKLWMDVYRDFGKAMVYYEDAVKYPQGLETSVETYNRLGACYFNLKRYKEAKAAWLKGLKINPTYKPIKINMDHAMRTTPHC